MIKRLLVLCFLLFVVIGLKAQPFGNEWISYSQPYYKIKVAQNGIYRIDSATLAAAGIPISSINPQNFQLFNKGTEQKIFVNGENDGVFNTGDFIEFYGEMNDGSLDALLYKNTAFLPNPYYSLVNDTAVYFLTWNSSTANARLQPETDTAFSAYIPDAYFFKEEIQNYHSDYYAGETDAVGGTDARYTRSEGWFDGNTINLGGTNSYSLNTSNQYTAGPDAIVKTVAVGASKNASLVSLGQPDHHLVITYGPSNTILSDTAFKGYEANRFISSVPLTNLGSSTTNFSFKSETDAFSSNRTAVAYI